MLEEDEIAKLNQCILAVNKNKSEIHEDESFIGIVKKYVSQVAEAINE